MNLQTIMEMQVEFDAVAKAAPDENAEFWFTRDLQAPLGYGASDSFGASRGVG